MPRFSRPLTLWTFALLVACVLLAWPLHEAKHAKQPIADVIAAMQGAVPAATLDADLLAAPADDHGTGEAKGAGCAWCLFHAHHFAATHTPPMFSFHAEASPPPAEPPRGLPTGRVALAADPRGPPRA